MTWLATTVGLPLKVLNANDMRGIATALTTPRGNVDKYHMLVSSALFKTEMH